MDEKPEEQPDRPDEEQGESNMLDCPPLPWLPPQALPRQPVPTYPNGRWDHWTDWL